MAAEAEAPLRAEQLEAFMPRYAVGRVADSASDLEHAEARCAVSSSCCDAASAADAATLRELARAARRLGRLRLGLGDYGVLKLGQKGGFGRIAQCRVDGCSSLLAVKTVELNRQGDPHSCTPPSPALDARRLRRAGAEVAALQALPPSPLLPSLLDCFTSRDGRRAHIVTPFVPGTDLAGRLQAADGPLPLSHARFFTAEVLLALELVHSVGFVYRDLKPENVMVNESTGHVVLVDFDLAAPRLGLEAELAPWRDTPLDEAFAAAAAFDASARSGGGGGSESGGSGGSRDSAPGVPAAAAAATAAATQAHTFAGTAEYAAPEVVGGAPHGAAADLWQLGVLLYEMLYGRTPFQGRFAERTFYNVVAAPLAVPPRGAAPAPDEDSGDDESAQQRPPTPDGGDSDGEGAGVTDDKSATAAEARASARARELAEAEALLRAMLARTGGWREPSDPRVRLGGGAGGTAAIRAHPFFAPIDWAALPWAKPPCIISPVRLRGSSVNLADIALGAED